MAIHDFDEDGYAPPHPDEPSPDDYTRHLPAPWVTFQVPGDVDFASCRAGTFQDGRWFILPAYDAERLPLVVIDESKDQHPETRARAGHNAERIVACVNYCAGMSNEALSGPNPLAGRDPKRLEALVEALHRLASKWTDHTIPDAHAEVTVVVEEFAAFLGEGDES